MRNSLSRACAQPGLHFCKNGAQEAGEIVGDVIDVRLVATGELGWALTGTRGVGISDRIHDVTVFASLPDSVEILSVSHRWRSIVSYTSL